MVYMIKDSEGIPYHAWHNHNIAIFEYIRYR